jgi:hypothetical protein
MTYRKNNYMGSNCLLCVSGNFSNDEVIPFIEKQFHAKLYYEKHPSNLFYSNIKLNPEIKQILTLKPNINKHIHIDKNINRSPYESFDTTQLFTAAAAMTSAGRFVGPRPPRLCLLRWRPLPAPPARH